MFSFSATAVTASKWGELLQISLAAMDTLPVTRVMSHNVLTVRASKPNPADATDWGATLLKSVIVQAQTILNFPNFVERHVASVSRKLLFDGSILITQTAAVDLSSLFGPDGFP